MVGVGGRAIFTPLTAMVYTKSMCVAAMARSSSLNVLTFV